MELSLNAASSQSDVEERSRNGMLRAISGTRGLGVQRAFWNDETREMVAIVWMGGGLAGWPGVAHGGGIATIFEEVMARMVRGPVGDVGMYTIPSHLVHKLCSGLLRRREGDTNDGGMCRAATSADIDKFNVRETHIYPRLLRPAGVLLATGYSAGRTATGT